jgi:protein-disulfide isomerase
LTEIHPYATIAAESAEAAGAQGKFWDMHGMLFQNQPHFELERLIAYANTIGLDIDAFTSDLETHRHMPKIREDFLGGARSGVNGTPTLFINGERFDSPADEALLAGAIDAARRHRHVVEPF